jgi:hypothetical protein
MPLKIPPKLWRNRKALENYVHKHVFPKVSKTHRNYLAQFFTELFSDGFDPHGNFSQWDSTAGACTVITDPVYEGTYAAQLVVYPTNVAILYKALGGSYSTVYMRAYVYLETTPASGQRFYIGNYIRNNANSKLLAAACLYNDSGTLKWDLRYRTDSIDENHAYSTTPSISTGQWYCIEIKFSAGNGDGEARMYIDGVEKITATGLTNDDYNADSVRVLAYVAEAGNQEVICLDNIIVADAYIGLDATLQAVTDSLSLSDAVLRNRTLSISDSLSLNDLLHGDKTLLLIDATGLSELITVIIAEATKYVTDTVNVADESNIFKNLKISDTLTLVDASTTPSRVSIALDVVGLADASLVHKMMQINENMCLAEVVEVGTDNVKKTKLFLIIGDLAVQLTGD